MSRVLPVRVAVQVVVLVMAATAELPARRFVVAWDESLAGVRTAAYSVGMHQADGAMRFGTPTWMAGAGGPTLYPVMAPVTGGVVAAWTSGAPGASVIHVRQLVAAGAPASAPS